MNERETIIQQFTDAGPVIEELKQSQLSLVNAMDEEKKAKKLSGILFTYLYVLLGMILCGIAALLFALILPDSLDTLVELLVIAGTIVFTVIMRKRGKQKQEEAQKKIDEEKQHFISIANKPELSFIPPDYRHTLCIVRLYNYFVNGRVNTMQEAVNLYETEAHQERMEEAAKYGSLSQF